MSSQLATPSTTFNKTLIGQVSKEELWVEVQGTTNLNVLGLSNLALTTIDL